MILSTPASLLFSTVMIARTLLTLTSTNWLLAWIAIEINLLRFIPLISNKKSNQETEASIKYFLAQALGSALIILSRISLWTLSWYTQWWTRVLTLSLLLKLGAAPCHFWFPGVITSLAWPQALLLTTWQKLAPLGLVCFSSFSWNRTSNTLISLSIITNALIGGIIGINQTHLRTLLAYSSITHIGWVISAIQINNPNLSITYFLFYIIITLPIFLILHLLSISRHSQFLKLITSTKLIPFSFILLLLSLGGLPPLTGFLPKWLIISSLISINHLTLLILLLGSYLNLYFYLNLTFNTLSSISYLNLTPQINLSSNTALLLLPASSALGLIIIFPYAMTLLN